MSTNQSQRSNSNNGADKGFFDLHVRGIGYLNRVRTVSPKGNGRKAEPFIACGINAVHGSVEDYSTTLFDCRVSGDEAIELITALTPAVEAQQKVFIAFKIGDIYPHMYERNVRDGKPGEKESACLIKGRLLQITNVKIDGEEVYRREYEKDVTGSERTSSVMTSLDLPSMRTGTEG